MMWPRIALWVAGFLAVPAAKYVYNSIFEQPSYMEDLAKANAERAAKEQADRDELEELRRRQRSMASQKGD